MEREVVRKYKERWQRVNEVTLREQLEGSPETKFRQLAALLRMARQLGWDLSGSETDIQTVRKNWNVLRSRLHDRSS